MTPEQEVLLGLVRILDRLGIAYMFCGSVASSYHGRPRLTHDADVVHDPTPQGLEQLVRNLEETGFYVDGKHARDAFLRRLQFNAIDIRTGFKLDLIFRKDRPFSREEFARRQAAELIPNASVALSSAEDTILAKLEWSRKAGRSEKQLEDATGVLAVNPDLDRAYIERWASELGVLDSWRELAGQGPRTG